jgi:hypothetical protein
VLGAGQCVAQVAVVVNVVTAGVAYDGGTDLNTDDYLSLDGITYRAR